VRRNKSVMFAHAGEVHGVTSGAHVSDAASGERAVSREPAGARKPGGVTFSPAHPKCAKTRFFPLEYVEGDGATKIFTSLMHRSPQ
jgi:hypothetical protein